MALPSYLASRRGTYFGRNRAIRRFARPRNAGQNRGVPDPDLAEQRRAPEGSPEPPVEQPAKLLRIAMMVRETLEEVRRAPLDQDARQHLRDVHERVVRELKQALSGQLAEELERIIMPVPPGEVPSEPELRIMQAALLGWLEGLFQGIQAAVVTQQLSAQAQLEEMRRRGLPRPELQGPPPERPPGQYL